MAGSDEVPTQHVSPKSEPSIHGSFAWFLNATSRNVGVYWLGYDGLPVLYETLKPAKQFKVRTYVGHPWIAADTKTHDRMLLKHEFIYFPRTIDRPLDPGCDASRWSAKITLPLFTLRNRSMQVVASHLLRNGLHVDDLELPSTLKNELIHVVANHSDDFIELYKKNSCVGLQNNTC